MAAILSWKLIVSHLTSLFTVVLIIWSKLTLATSFFSSTNKGTVTEVSITSVISSSLTPFLLPLSDGCYTLPPRLISYFSRFTLTTLGLPPFSLTSLIFSLKPYSNGILIPSLTNSAANNSTLSTVAIGITGSSVFNSMNCLVPT